MTPKELKDILQNGKKFIVNDLDTCLLFCFDKNSINTKQDECVIALNKEIRDFSIEENELILIVSDYNDKEREKFKIRCQIADLKKQIRELEEKLK